MNALILIAAGVWVALIAWVMYLAIMMLKLERHNLTRKAKVIAYPVVLFGVVLDVLLNLVVGTVAFLEPPRELLFTARLQRHMQRDNWRGRLARSICKHFLDPFDGGNHC